MVSGPLTAVSATSESRTPEARRQFSLQTCIPKKVPLSHITHLYGYLFQMYLEDNVWVENKWYKQLSYLKHHLSKTIRMFPMFFKVRKEYFFILPPLKKCRMIQSTKCLGLNYHNIQSLAGVWTYDQFSLQLQRDRMVQRSSRIYWNRSPYCCECQKLCSLFGDTRSICINDFPDIHSPERLDNTRVKKLFKN